MPKRGDRAAPPPAADEWEIRFASQAAANGWEDLCRQAAGGTRAAWEVIRRHPARPDNLSRHHRLKAEVASANVGGKTFPQWQYEVTGAGRIWFCVDEDRRTVWLTRASVGHPKATD